MKQNKSIDFSFNQLLQSKSSTSRQKQDRLSETTTLPSFQNFSNTEDQYRLGDTISNQQTRQKFIKKNHLVVKMLARVNGEELSSDNTRLKQRFSENQSTTKPAAQFKQIVGIKEIQQNVARINDRQEKIPILREAVKKLISVRECVKDTSLLMSSKSVGKLLESSTCSKVESKINSNYQNQKIRLKQQFVKLQQINLALSKTISALNIEIQQKCKEIKEMRKLHKRQLNDLYYKMTQKVKAKQDQCSRISQKFKQQNEAYQKISKQLCQSSKEVKQFRTIITLNKKEIQKLQSTIRQQESNINRSKLLAVRLEHCEKQIKYYSQQLFNQKQLSSTHTKQNQNLLQEQSRIKKQLHQMVLSPKSDLYSQIVLLSQSMSEKHCNEDTLDTQNQNMRRQIQHLKRKEQNVKSILNQSTQQIIKLRLATLNFDFSKQQF